MKDIDLSCPLMVEIETQTDCNRACQYCPNSFLARPAARLEMNIIDKVLRELSGMGFKGRLSFHFYNEPLLDDRLPHIIVRTRQHLPGSRIVLYTNGDLLNGELFRQLIHCGCDRLLVTAQEHAQHDLRWIRGLSPGEQEKLFYQTWKNPEIIYTNRGGLVPFGPLVHTPLRLSCMAPSMTMVLSATGNVVLCYEDFREQCVMGNVMNDTVPAIWSRDAFKFIRQRLAQGDRTTTMLCQACNNSEHQELVPSD